MREIKFRGIAKESKELIIGRDCICSNCCYQIDGRKADKDKCKKGITATKGCGLWEYQYIESKMNKALEAFDIEKEKPADINGCGYCKGEATVSFVYFSSLTDTGIQAQALYCPMCGRKMPTEEVKE